MKTEFTSRRGLAYKAKSIWRVFRRNRAAVTGLVTLIIILGLTASAPFLTPYQPLRLVSSPLQPPLGSVSGYHPFGTDNLGRDIFSQVLYGSRTSLTVGFLAATTSIILGILVGALSGYYGGYLDESLMRITELFQVVPRLFLALTAVALLSPSIWNLIWVIGLTSWPTTARLVRAEFLSLRERPFVEAVKGMGAGDTELVFREILPNATPPIIVNASFEVARAIILEAGLSFLGVGDANVPSLGRILQAAQAYLQTAWWMSIFAGIFIALIVLSLNLVGDGLNDALNPRLRER